MEELGSIREMQLRESEVSGKKSGLEKKIHYAEIEEVNRMCIFYMSSPLRGILAHKFVINVLLPSFFEIEILIKILFIPVNWSLRNWKSF